MKRHTYRLSTGAALGLVALMATGCSESAKKAETTTTSNPVVPVKPIIHDAEETAPVVAGPVTFADGEAAFKTKNYTEATRIFMAYTDQHPKNAWGFYMLGLSAWKGGDLMGAEMAFGEALTLDPKHVKSLVNLSRVLLDEKRPEEAVEKLVLAEQIDPTSKDVVRLLGRAYQEQGKTEEAIEAYQRAIMLDDTDSWALNNLGLIMLDRGCAEDALPLFAKAVEIGKDVAAFHNNLGMALEHTGRFSAAAEAYKGALTADPNYEKARQNLARVEKVKEDPTIPPVEPLLEQSKQ